MSSGSASAGADEVVEAPADKVPRRATTVNYDLSPDEQRLYEAVSSYVQEGMGRAQAIEPGAGPDSPRAFQAADPKAS